MLLLSRVCCKKRVSVVQLREARDQITSAFNSLWKAGIAHGDVHEGNLIVCKTGDEFKVTIIDLGHSVLLPQYPSKEEMAGFEAAVQRDALMLSDLLSAWCHPCTLPVVADVQHTESEM